MKKLERDLIEIFMKNYNLLYNKTTFYGIYSISESIPCISQDKFVEVVSKLLNENIETTNELTGNKNKIKLDFLN